MSNSNKIHNRMHESRKPFNRHVRHVHVTGSGFNTD